MNVTSRADDIRTRLTKYFLDEIGCPVSPMPSDEWDLIVDELGPYARFGIAWPMPFAEEGEPPLIIPFQAELIADVTSQLSDEDLSDYLDAVEHLGELQIIERLADDGEVAVDSETALRNAEAELDKEFPGTVDLLQRTQFNALDRWRVQ